MNKDLERIKYLEELLPLLTIYRFQNRALNELQALKEKVKKDVLTRTDK